MRRSLACLVLALLVVRVGGRSGCRRGRRRPPIDPSAWRRRRRQALEPRPNPTPTPDAYPERDTRCEQPTGRPDAGDRRRPERRPIRDPRPSAEPDLPTRMAVPTPPASYIVMLSAGTDTKASVEAPPPARGHQARSARMTRAIPRLHRCSSTPTSARRSSRIPTSSPSSRTKSIELTAQTIPNGVRRVGRDTSSTANDRRARCAGRCGRRDHRHRDRNAPRSQRRGRLQLRHVESQPLARQGRPRHARRGHGRRDRQRLRRRRRRPRGSAVGRPDPQRRRLRPAVVVRLRPRLGPRAARPDRLGPAAVRGRQHERREVGRRRSCLRERQRRHPPRRDLSRRCAAASRSWPPPRTTAAARARACRRPTTRSSR